MTKTSKEQWPPDYRAVTLGRGKLLNRLKTDRKLLAVFMKKYSNPGTGAVAFINDWCITFDPRNAGKGVPVRMPFILFKRQRQFVRWLDQCLLEEVNGLCEKSRDMGATWLCCAYSVWLFLFVPGAAVGWGSRKAELVDRIGDPSSIFEKIRQLLMGIPRIFWPEGFNESHMGYMKIISPRTGASITGESGDNIGRGGRTLVYFKDEAAHYERPELIEAALADTTRVQVDISSVNGLGNVFHRKREAGIDWQPGVKLEPSKPSVFVLDWSDHPAKTQDWYKARKQAALESGLLHVFAQEVDRDYSAAVAGVIIPAEWVRSAIDAHLVLGWDDGREMEDGDWMAGADVADSEEGDKNALAIRKGAVLRDVEAWGDRDTGVATRRFVDKVLAHTKRSRVQYDCIGVGSGVKAEVNRLTDEDVMPRGIKFVPWNAGAAVLDPERHVEDGDSQTPLNKDFYLNLKAQGWWQLRRRFEKTHRAVTEGVYFEPEELISLDSRIPALRTLQKELSQPTASKSTAKLKLQVDKKPDGTRSPNLADAVMMAYWPADIHGYDSSLDWVGADDGMPLPVKMKRFA